MRVVGAVVGIVLGFTIGVILTEWIFVNDQSWPDAVPVVLAVLGGLTGSALGRRASARRAAARRAGAAPPA
jgi:hypothetical protein